MILLDFGQVCMANLMVHLEINKGNFNNEAFRFMILNTIRKNVSEFRSEYGKDVIIACDSYGNWRKKWFPQYKAGRAKSREESTLDWESIFKEIHQLRDDLREYFPYRVIDVPECEADDVIGVLCEKFGQDFGGERILILSGDKDFIQLHKWGNVFQYSPVKKCKITHNDPEFFLINQIITGDKGDGVPNILSADDTFVEGKRQTTLSSKRVNDITEKIREGTYDTPEYHRNRVMIDLSQTPEYLKINIMEAYDKQADKPRNKILNYLIKSRMGRLVEQVSDF